MSSSTTVLSPQIKRKAILSCYHTLIHLGDLSRYRASKLDDPEKRNWGPAVGYYGLAGEIWPESGISHNQRAMIAVETGNHLSTIYHFYRALSVEKPHPLAKDNLEKEFKRIITAWDKGELIKTGSKDGNSGAGSALIAWFVRLHSKCYKGEQFTGHDELEKEVLGQLTTEIKDRSLETTMVKFIIINVAAEDFSSARLQGRVAAFSFSSLSYINLLQMHLPNHRINRIRRSYVSMPAHSIAYSVYCCLNYDIKQANRPNPVMFLVQHLVIVSRW